MFEFRRGILGVSVLIGLGLTASMGCGSDIEDEPGGAGGGTGASGGAAGSGGSSGATGSGGSGNAPACKPTNTVCYNDGDPNGPGNECLATRNNVGKPHVQIRSVWARTPTRRTGGSAGGSSRSRWCSPPWPRSWSS